MDETFEMMPLVFLQLELVIVCNKISQVVQEATVKKIFVLRVKMLLHHNTVG